MKRIKKTLCLMLVLALALGMVPAMTATTALASPLDGYADRDDIEYAEAASILTALDLMEGDSTGFRPDDTLTRAEAAAIITRLMLTRSVANSLTGADSRFRDVNASQWWSGYIAYCVSQGIIEGYLDNTFRPHRNVTGIEFTIMLLRALGYGTNGEYSGDFWSTNAAIDGIRLGILTTDVNHMLPATRQEAALYAFNALDLNFVRWNPWTQRYDEYIRPGAPSSVLRQVVHPDLTQSGETIFNGRTSATWLLKGEAIYRPTPVDTVLATRSNVTNLTNLVTPGASGYAGFQADATVHLYLNGRLQGAVTGETIANLSTVLPVSIGDVVELIDNKIVEVTPPGGIYALNNPDGKVSAIAVTRYNFSRVTATAAATSTLEASVTIAGFGQKFADEFVSGFAGLARNDYILYADIRTATGPDASEGIIAYKPTVFNGNVTRFNTNVTPHTITIDGTVRSAGNYSATGRIAALTPGVNPAWGITAASGEQIFYADANNYLVGLTPVAGPPAAYAVIDSIAFVAGSGVAASNYVEARLVFNDGTTRVERIASIRSGDITYNNARAPIASAGTDVTNLFTTATGSTPLAATAISTPGLVEAWAPPTGTATARTANHFLVVSTLTSENAVFTNRVYTYSENTNGTYSLTLANTNAPTAALLGTGNADIASRITQGLSSVPGQPANVANSNTVYVYKTGTAAAPVWTVYTGFASAPSFPSAGSGASGIVTHSAVSAGSVVFVYVNAVGVSVGDAPPASMVYFWNRNYETIQGNPTTYEFIGVINGEAAEPGGLVTSDATTRDNIYNGGAGLYRVDIGSNGRMTSAVAVGSSHAGSNFTLVKARDNASNNNILIYPATLANGVAADDTTFPAALTYTNDTTVYVLNLATRTVRGGSIEDVTNGSDFYVRTIGNSTSTNQVQRRAAAEIWVLDNYPATDITSVAITGGPADTNIGTALATPTVTAGRFSVGGWTRTGTNTGTVFSGASATVIYTVVLAANPGHSFTDTATLNSGGLATSPTSAIEVVSEDGSSMTITVTYTSGTVVSNSAITKSLNGPFPATPGGDPVAGIPVPTVTAAAGYTVTQAGAWDTGVTGGNFDTNGTATYVIELTATTGNTFAADVETGTNWTVSGAASVTAVRSSTDTVLTITWTVNLT